MDAKEFSNLVRIAGRTLPPDAVRQSLDYWLEVMPEPFQAAQVAQVVQLAGRFKIPSSDSDKASTPLAPGARDVVASDTLCDRLEPEILGIRVRVFGSEKIPFRGDRQAVRWIEETAADQEKSRRALDSKDVLDLVSRLRVLTGADVGLTVQTLAYPKPPAKWVYHVPAQGGKKLYDLARECASISMGSGFSKVAVLWWILRGVCPILPRVEITRSLRSSGPSALTVKINGAPLTWREAWSIFKKAQKMPGRKRRTPSPQQARMIAIVKARGPVPKIHGQKGVFWELVRADLETEFGSKAPSTWQAIRKAYHEKVY